MGTKRVFDEELQEFIEHPKHHDYGNKQPSFAENELPLETYKLVGFTGDGGRKYFRIDNSPKSENDVIVPDMVNKEFEITAPLPLVTGINNGEYDTGHGSVFSTNVFSDYFEYTRRQLFRYEDVYSSSLNNSPRKTIPIGPDHQVHIPEFDSDLAKNYKNISGGMERFMGVCVIPMDHSVSDELSAIQTDCKCLDGGSIRCVQVHVKEAREKLLETYGNEKFVGLGFLEMGEQVAGLWSEEEERLFSRVVYSNPASVDLNFWKQLSTAFPSRTMKEIVSYYFNVFILRRRAVQNRSSFLDVDSDDDEWRESYEGNFGVNVANEEFVVGGSDEDDASDGDDNDDDGGGGHDVVIGLGEDTCTSNEA